MSELQSRKYKEVNPEETVKRLKKILHDMKIDVEEKWSKKSSVGTYSLRICIKGTDIGQNGKGMTKEFAMASGYAEFFERLQNGILRFRVEKPTEELPFSNSPDEKHLSVEELMTNNNSFLEEILRANNYGDKTKEEKIEYIKQIFNEKSNLVEKEDYISLPYYSVKNKDIEYIPDRLFSYLYNTNGMCAGNSIEEAMIEGLSEILERYVNIQIFKQKLTLPQIPESYIENFPKVKEMMEKISKNDKFYFRLVDCSLGGKYPVAGLYIVEKNTGKFGFKLGAHPDYGVAMERCFTEAAQGRDIYGYSQIGVFDFYDSGENESKKLTKFLFADLSTVPYQIIGEKSDYEFTEMPDVSELDNKTILKNLVNTILEEGRDILLRNVSVLGFPTVSIAIPGMSELSFDPSASYFNLIITMQSLLKDLKKINLDNIEQVINIMETLVNEIGYEELSILISLKDNSVLPCEQIGKGAKYFLAIAYIMNAQYDKAVKILAELKSIAEIYIPNELEKIIIRSVYYYSSAMDKFNDHEKAMYYIRVLFDQDISQAIDFSFRSKEKTLINHYAISEEDYVDNDDSYYLPFMRRFREAQRDNKIDQMANKEIFE